MQLRINPEGFRRIIERAGVSETELPRLLGVDRSVVYRVLRGKARPGNRFIAGAWSLFGTKVLPELFTTEEDKK